MLLALLLLAAANPLLIREAEVPGQHVPFCQHVLGDESDNADTARAVEAACWTDGRAYDFPEQFTLGHAPTTVQEK